MNKGQTNYVLFDTNILLDAVCVDRPQHREANRALRFCNGGGDLGYAASCSFKDSYYVLRKRYGEEHARKAIEYLMGLLIVAPLGGEECDLSMRSDEPDFEDGLIRACAELNNIDFILTRDAGAFRHSKVRAVTCAEYLDIVGER